MIKIYLAFLATVFSLVSSHSFAQTVHEVNASNFVFTPDNFVAVVGDIVRFKYLSGFPHTTTSTTIPAGAATWNQDLNPTSLTFDYHITIPGTYNYKCTPHEGGGMVAQFIVSSVAPVKLAGFAAEPFNKTVLLKWKTLTEANSAYFSVQQSMDGVSFTEAGRVMAAGNSNSALSYSFTITDISPNQQFFYFRLLTVDKDEKQQFSDIILYRQEAVASVKLIDRMFPNPAEKGDHLHLHFNSENYGKLLVGILDASGKKFPVIPLTAVQGVNRTHVPLTGLSTGNYFLRFNLNGRQETRLLIIK